MSTLSGGEAYFLATRVLLQVARDACERSRGPGIDGIVSLVFSAFYVESAVNELLHRAMTIPQDDLKDVPPLRLLRQLAIAAELESKAARFHVKLQLISVALRGEPFDTGRQPYQDVDLLMALRHTIVHNRPETLRLGTMVPGDPSVPQEELDRLYRRLISRGVVPEPDRFVLTGLLTALATRGVGVWAANSAITLVETIVEALPSNWRSRFFFGSDFTPIIA